MIESALSTNGRAIFYGNVRVLPAQCRRPKAGTMINNKACLASVTVLALSLGGCASVEGDFPSLSKRPYETDNPVEQDSLPSAPLTSFLPANLQTQTDGLVARARKAHAAFEAALPAARNAAQSANGAVPGSEGWINAHMILSRADGTRADAVAALSELDKLITMERDKGADAGLVALLAKPQGQIAAMVNEETAEIDRLARMIGL
jgi:hypothetical protein